MAFDLVYLFGNDRQKIEQALNDGKDVYEVLKGALCKLRSVEIVFRITKRTHIKYVGNS